MNRIKEHLKDQGVLFATHYVGDRLPEDHAVFQFDKLLQALDISSITNTYSSQGGKMYDPRCMLGVLVYAYFQGITSSRKIADGVQTSLPYIYLSGASMIKYRSISEFRKKHIEHIKAIFINSVKMALEVGLIQESDIFALDGTKIEADASGSQTKSKEDWEEKEAHILSQVEDFLREWEEADLSEEGLDELENERMQKASKKLQELIEKKAKRGPSNLSEKSEEPNEPQIPKNETPKESDEPQSKEKEESEELETSQTTVSQIEPQDVSNCESLLEKLDKISSMIEANPDASEKTFLNLTDHDTRLMKSDSTTKECFNAQAITNNQVIVAADVSNHENDQGELQVMVEQLKSNLAHAQGGDNDNEGNSEESNKGQPHEPVKLLADAGYNKGENLEYLDGQEGIDPYLSMKNRKEEKEVKANDYHKDHFVYDEDEDRYTCPQGKSLEFQKDQINNGKKSSVYTSNVGQCMFCPAKSLCLSNKKDSKLGYRSVSHDDYSEYRKEMKEKMKREEAKKLYRQRAAEIEAVFGQITYNLGFRRFRLRGLKNVNGEFLIMALVHNLGKIMRYKAKNNQNSKKTELIAS